MDKRTNKLRRGGYCLLLAALTLVLYWPAHRFDFVNYDDPVYVTLNPQVQKGLTWNGVSWAFAAEHASNWQTLAPEIGLVQVGNQAYAERYTNVPLIGIFMARAWGVTEWALSSRQKAVGVSLAFGTALVVTDKNCLAHRNLGSRICERGQPEPVITHYEKALQFKPDNAAVPEPTSK